MTSLNIQTITRVIIFILRFKIENYEQTDDFLLTDNLRTVQLQNLYDIFQRDRNYPFSRFKAQNYDFEIDDLVLKEIRNSHQNRLSIQRNNNCSCLICFGIQTNMMFREIHIPVSKALFIKVINFSPGQDTILSTREIYDIIYHFFMILDNTSVITCILLKQLLADEELFDKLNILHQENIHSVMSNYQGTLEARSIELGNLEHILHTAFVNIHRIAMQEFIFVYKDEHNNVALTASKGDNKRKTHVVVYINLKDLWKPFCYLKVDSDFISQNWLLLQELLNRNSFFRSNVTLDIDFNRFYQQLAVLQKTTNNRLLAESKARDILLVGEFEHVNTFKLRFSEIICSIDFRFLKNKKIMLFCNNLLLTSLVYLPKNLKRIYIYDSAVKGNLMLPASTEVLSLKRAIIYSEAKIMVNNECLRIDIEETVGDIDIPGTFGIDALFFNKEWKKCHLLRNSTGAIEELIIVKSVLSQSWNIIAGVKKIHFEDIETEGIFRIIINADCENLSLKNCTVVYNLAENVLLTNFGLIKFSKDSEFHLSNENGKYKLNIRNMELARVRSLNERIKEVELEDVYILGDNVFAIHIGCRNISLKNCRGSFEFFFETRLRGINLYQLTNYFSLKFNEDTGKYKMSLIEVNIVANLILWNKLEDLHLESITNESSQRFEIKEGCNRTKLMKCRGFFKFPGIHVDNRGYLKLNIPTNELCLTKLPNNLFLLHMSDIFIYQPIHILPDIKFGKFERILSYDNLMIKFEGRCETLFLISCYVLLDQPETTIYERLIFNKMFEINSILNVKTKELVMNNCKIIADVKLCEALYKLHFYDVEVLEKGTVIIPKHCLNVMIRSCFGAFSIPGINEHHDQATMVFRRLGNFHFFRYKGNDHYFLKMENCNIDRHICIRKEIKDIILSNITFSSKRPKQRTSGRAILNSESLQSLTLKSSLFLYNATIHRKLAHLHLERMCFNHDVIIGVNIENLILKSVTMERNSLIVVGKNISYLVIYNSSGVLNFKGFLNLELLRLWGNEKIVYERELQSGSAYLKLENVTFVSDYQSADDVKTLYLTQIKTINNSKISINEACEKIVTNLKGKIYFIKEKSIEKAVFLNYMPFFETGCWTFSASHDIEEITTPSHLRSIRFENIELRLVTVVVNEGCEEVSIVHCCDGKFNLVEIQGLLKLTYHPEQFSIASLSYSNLCHVKELDLAFNFMLDFFEDLLCNCFNVEILTLRALTFDPDKFHWRRLLNSHERPFLSLFENFNLRELEELLSENFPSEENTSSLWVLLNEKMNSLIVPIFTTRSQFKLETLKIVGFYLSDRSLEKISSFSIMKKLSVDYNFVSVGLFEHLPPNLETLEILSGDIFEPDDINSMKNVRNAESMKNINGPKMLIIEGSFFETPDNFTNLPLKLHSLKISYHDITSVVYEPSIEKICLRELIVFFKSTKNNGYCFGLTSIEKKICIQEMFGYLSNFIDFNKLDSLMVEDGDEKTEHDRFEIY